MTGDFTRTHSTFYRKLTHIRNHALLAPYHRIFHCLPLKSNACLFDHACCSSIVQKECGHVNFKGKKAIYVYQANLKDKRNFFSHSQHSMFFLLFTMLPLRWLFMVVVAFFLNETKIILPVGSWKFLPTPFVHSCPSLLISFPSL